MKFRLLIIVAVLLASCWQPLGSSYEPQSDRNYNRDLYECEREASLAGSGNRQRVFEDCMKARGYKQR